MSIPTIAFQTSCYENSYNLLLRQGLLEIFLNRFIDVTFSEINVIINNVNNKEKVRFILENYPYPVNYYFAFDEADEALSFFNLSMKDFETGPYFSIHHFVGLYKTKCDYLFHVSEDCNIDNLTSSFVYQCIDILESNDDYISALPRWGKDPESGAKEEAIKEDGNFYIALTLSDQINILKTKVFKQDIYHFYHPDSEKYPSKGGDSFERRVNSYMWTHNKFRAIHKNYYYLHGYYDSIIKRS